MAENQAIPDLTVLIVRLARQHKEDCEKKILDPCQTSAVLKKFAADFVAKVHAMPRPPEIQAMEKRFWENERRNGLRNFWERELRLQESLRRELDLS
jgi:hypothetical protein